MKFTKKLPRGATRPATTGASSSFGAPMVRAYVMQPYTMAKDLRTGVETADVARVLDGDLDGFLRAALAQGVGRPYNGCVPDAE